MSEQALQKKYCRQEKATKREQKREEKTFRDVKIDEAESTNGELSWNISDKKAPEHLVGVNILASTYSFIYTNMRSQTQNKIHSVPIHIKIAPKWSIRRQLNENVIFLLKIP